MYRFFCWLGWHPSYYYDSAHFHHAMRCNRCQEYLDPKAGAMLRQERQLWNEAPEGSFRDQAEWVRERMPL